MINTLSIASDGYLNTTKRVLSISVSGYLSYAGGTPPQPPIIPSIPTVGGGSGGSFGVKLSDGVNKQYRKKIYYTNDEPSRTELDDNDVLLIIKTFLKCQK